MSRESFNSFVILVFIFFVFYKFLKNIKKKYKKNFKNKKINKFSFFSKFKKQSNNNLSTQKIIYKGDFKKNNSVELKKIDDYVLNLDVVKYKLKNNISDNLKDKNNDFGKKCFTNNGEEVKSFSEKLIADYFFQSGISYFYEYPLLINGKVFSHPDFYLSDYDVYIEFWGLMSKDFYKDNSMSKRAIYYRNNVKFFSLYPYDLKDLDYNFKRKLYDCCGIYLELDKGNRNYDNYKTP